METMTGGDDFQMMSDALYETAPATNRLFFINHVTGFTTGTFDGESAAPVYVQFNPTGTIEECSQEEVVHSGGLLTLGSLKTTTVQDVFQKDDTVYPYSGAASGYPQQADELIYEGVAYHMVGKPFREFAAQGRLFTRANWRRT